MKIFLIILVIVILAITIFWFNREPAVAPNETTFPFAASPTLAITATPIINLTDSPMTTPQTNQASTTPPIPTPAETPKTSIITFASGAANPLYIEIKKGDTVKFLNNESIAHWPASGVHPTHQICPGFDSLRGINKGESYSFTFNEAKVCPWHDHLNPSIKGQIVVQ